MEGVTLAAFTNRSFGRPPSIVLSEGAYAGGICEGCGAAGCAPGHACTAGGRVASASLGLIVSSVAGIVVVALAIAIAPYARRRLMASANAPAKGAVVASTSCSASVGRTVA